jgi:hypothetical protein
MDKIETEILPEITKGTVKRVLGFNEPDSPNQANMSVDKVVSFWPTLEAIGIPLVSPSPYQDQRKWMLDFMTEVAKSCLRMEYLATHWYGGTNVQAFKDRLRVTFLAYGGQRPLLITEFAIADCGSTSVQDNQYSQADVLVFMKDALPWLEEQDWIAGYSWFSFKQTSAVGAPSALFDEDGTITVLGEYYASITTENILGDQTIGL